MAGLPLLTCPSSCLVHTTVTNNVLFNLKILKYCITWRIIEQRRKGKGIKLKFSSCDLYHTPTRKLVIMCIYIYITVASPATEDNIDTPGFVLLHKHQCGVSYIYVHEPIIELLEKTGIESWQWRRRFLCYPLSHFFTEWRYAARNTKWYRL